MCDHCGCRDLTPVTRLMDEHDRLRELTGLIRSALGGGDDARARSLVEEVLAVLGPHVAREEEALFPLLRRESSLADHVDVLEAEHAGLYDAIDDLDDVDPGPRWGAGVLAVLHALDVHMYKEDFGLFPAALATLDGADWDAVDRWDRRPAGPQRAGGGVAS